MGVARFSYAARRELAREPRFMDPDFRLLGTNVDLIMVSRRPKISSTGGRATDGFSKAKR